MFWNLILAMIDLPFIGWLFVPVFRSFMPLFANVSGAGTEWNLPNYAGEILTSSHTATPLLNIIGGLSGGNAKITTNFQFPLNSNFDHETAAQPSITETASLTAPTAREYVRAQQFNVVQKHHQAITLSYDKMAGSGRLSGINTAGANNPAPNELDFQISTHLVAARRDIEFSIPLGTYQTATNAGVASTTRGLNEAASDAGNTVAASGALVDKDLLDQLLVTMDDNGADFENVVIYCNLFQKQTLGDVYGFAPESRTVGGVNLDTIWTDAGAFGIVTAKSGFQTASVLTLIDIVKIDPVFMLVPEDEDSPSSGNKGIFFVEKLAKDGASSKWQLFGYFGLDYKANWYHGTITGLATS